MNDEKNYQVLKSRGKMMKKRKNREMEELNQRVDGLEEKMELLLNKDYSE